MLTRPRTNRFGQQRLGHLTEPGFQERVYQIAQDAIYPPVRVGVNGVIENLNLPGHDLMVIRVACHETINCANEITKSRRSIMFDSFVKVEMNEATR